MPLTYTLTGPSGGALPDGLRFDQDTRILSGAPTAKGTSTLTYTVTDANGASVDAAFTVTVAAVPALTELAGQTYTVGTAITDLELPAAAGGTAPLTYTLTGPSGGALPDGLSFDQDTRILSGAPTAATAAAVTLTYTATDANGAAATRTFTVTVSDGPTLTAPADHAYTVGTAITDLELPAAASGTAPLIYTLTGPSGGALPDGLSFDQDTRILSGAPTAATAAAVTLTYTVTDLELPAAAGGTMPLTYTLTGPSGGALPDGLSFDQDARILSGAPTTEGTSTLTYTVTDANGASVDAAFTVTVSDGPTLTAPADQAYTAGAAITDLELPAAAGGTAPLTYTLTGPSGGALPDGLRFDQDTRILSGAPTAKGTSTLTYTVTDANGASVDADFTVTVSDGPTLNAPAGQTYTADTAITDLTLPVATGGTAPLTYDLTGPEGGDLPAGLSFDKDTRILSGAPTAKGTSTLTYTVTDANGASVDADFTVTVSDGPTLNAPAGQTYTADTAITDLTLPVATGGTAPLTYDLTGPEGGDLPAGLSFDKDTRILSGAPTDQAYTAGTAITDLELLVAGGGTAPFTYTLTGPEGGDLPAGLSFDQDTRILSGIPTAKGTSTLTYTVTDANGAVATRTFTVTVARAAAADASLRGLALSAGALTSAFASDAISHTARVANAVDSITVTPTLNDANASVTVDGEAVASGEASGAISLAVGETEIKVVVTAADATTERTYTVTVTRVAADAADDAALSGLALSAGTLTPAFASDTASYTVAVARAAAADASLSALTLSAGAVLTPAFASDAISYTASVGNAVTSITVTPTLNDANASLTVDGAAVASGAASGAISLAVGGTEIKVVVTAADATTVRTYTVTVARAAAADASLSGLTLSAGALTPAFANATLTYTASVGNAVTSITVTPTTTSSDASFVISGTAADASTALTITDTTVSGLTVGANAITIEVTAADGTTTETYIVTVTVAAVPITVNPAAPIISASPATLTATVGTAITSVTITSSGGAVASYSIKPMIGNGLEFDTSTGAISGIPTAAADAVTYTITARNAGGTATATVAITVNPAVSIVTITEAKRLGLLPPRTDDKGSTITLPTSVPMNVRAADNGDFTVTSTLNGNDKNHEVTGISFGSIILTVTPVILPRATIQVSYTPEGTGKITDMYGNALSSFSVAVVNMAVEVVNMAEGEFAALNDIILPQVARAMAGSVVSAIERRIGQSGSAARALAVGGQRTLAGALSTHGKAMAEDRRDLKEMLAGSDFVLPLNAGDGAAGRSSAVFWGLGEYRKLSGDSVALDWDGDLSGVHLGVDARLGDDLLVGVAASRMQGDFNYKDDNAGDLLDLGKGEYGLNMTSAHPYIGWGAGQLDLWATVGYGEGKLEKTEKGKAMLSSDVDLRTVGAGGSGQLWEVGASGYRLKGEAMRSELEVKGAAGAAKVDAVRLRAALEGSQSRTLSAGGLFESSLEVGVRYDGGDGETGSGAEIGGRLSYRNPVTRATVEVRARALLGHSGGYEEWGIQGKLAVQPGADGQGLSLSLVPSYGESGSGIQELWRDGLLEDGDDNAAADYRARVEARLGYGFALRERDGVLTPYGEMTLGATDSYRIGLNWKAGSRFDLNLAGERSESNSGPTEHAILIKSEVRF